MKLSVVLPTLNRVETAQSLAARVRELFADLDLEVIIVTPAGAGTPRAPYVRFLRDRGGGVYSAYTQGVRSATGDYVWLIGDDDFPLDAAASLAPLIRAGEADVIVAPVLFSSGRIYRASRSRFMLLFYNWCQQGVIYRRSALLRYRFYRRLRIQADHYVNVLMRSDDSLRAAFIDAPICVFGVHGVSSRHQDLKFRALRPRLAYRTLGCMGYLLFEGIVGVMSIRKWFRRPTA